MPARSRIQEVRDELRTERVGGYTTNVYGTDQQETAYYLAEDVEAAFEALLHDGSTVDEGRTETRTEVRVQFWRESEQSWVDHVLIRPSGKNPDRPTKWRHKVFTITTTVGEWQRGKRP
jgi:hypothetical protein